ncbi:hypothetical protein EJB05_46612, partial [Eragrostis curvula]
MEFLRLDEEIEITQEEGVGAKSTSNAGLYQDICAEKSYHDHAVEKPDFRSSILETVVSVFNESSDILSLEEKKKGKNKEKERGKGKKNSPRKGFGPQQKIP